MLLTISIPAWGDAFLDIFERKTLPTLRAAVAAADGLDEVLAIVHTDQPERVTALSGDQLYLVPAALPSGAQWFQRLSAAHRAVISTAAPGTAVALLTADMAISADAFIGCARAFEQGRKLVCCNATRAVLEDFEPFTRSGRELSEWGWKHRHSMTDNITWPEGRSDDLHRVYFEGAGGVVARQWMPHPLAVMIDGRPLDFSPTIDCDLTARFRREEIHLVTSPDDLAAIELSPREKLTPSRDADEPPERMDLPPMRERYAHKEIQHRIYSWLLAQRIVVSGVGDGCADDEAVAPLLQRYNPGG